MKPEMFEILDIVPAKEPQPKCVVRLRTTMWSDNRGIHVKKSLTYLHRKSVGFNLLQEDISQAGAEEVAIRIINLDECEDGIYQFVACNVSKDWESGYVDDYDYKLVPIEE